MICGQSAGRSLTKGPARGVAEGENGMRQCLGYLSQITPVRLAWTSKMFGCKFKGRQPESLTPPEWQEIEAYPRTGKREDGTLA